MALSTQLVILAFALAAAGQTYTVLNNCPAPIDLYIGDWFETRLETGAQVVKTGLGPTPGLFWTPTNGGIRDRTNVAGAAGFQMNAGEGFYYIIRDFNHNELNTGISITPSVPAVDGFCPTIRCDEGACSPSAFYGPGAPSFTGYWPPILPDSPAQQPPVYQCKTPGANFLITFCPTGSWPNPSGEALKNNGSWNRCLDVKDGVLANGTPVQILRCNESSARQRFVYHRGTTQVRVRGTNFCLDSGTDPVNGSQLKIWECFDNLPAQTWFYTWDGRLVRAGTSLCMDLKDGIRQEGNTLQTWTCSDNNVNQSWWHGACADCD